MTHVLCHTRYDRGSLKETKVSGTVEYEVGIATASVLHETSLGLLKSQA